MNTTLHYIENSLRDYVADSELKDIALWIAEETTGLSRSEILCKDTTIIPNLEIILQRLRTGEPLQYVFGRTYWGGLKLKVNSSTLIPRPETWELVECVMQHCSEITDAHMLDIGTGSGCIAIALKKRFPNWTIHACDISKEALAMAQTNAAENNAQIHFFYCDILSDAICQYDIIVSNPPYICENEKSDMESRVLDYEPHSALFVPTEDPMLFYRNIARMKRAKRLFFEINENMDCRISEMLQKYGYKNIIVNNDMFGKHRIVSAEL